MPTPVTSMEQLMPFATAAELLAKKGGQPVTVAPTASVFIAMERMRDKHVGLLVVIEAEKIVGVVSERDCARAIVLGSLSARDTRVRDVMTHEVHTAPPDCKIPECIMAMHAKGVGHLPIVRDGKVQGVLTVHDLMGALIERHERLLRRFQEERLTLLFPDTGSY
jgi:CBS domain-containing protein